MRKKQCKRCGVIFETDREGKYLCDPCAKAVMDGNRIKPRTCRQCGATFDGGPRAWYCPACRDERQRDRNKQRRHTGSARQLGSTDICQRCGEEYIVEGGLQKYCKNCARTAILEKMRPVSRAYNASHKEELYAHKAEMRKQSKVCVVCGKPFDGRGPAVTCSAECAAIRKKQNQKRADLNRRDKKTKDK